MKKLIFFILFWLGALQVVVTSLFADQILPVAVPNNAPSIQMRVDVQPKKVYIGDPIEFMVTVLYSSTVASAPLQVDKTLGEFEILASKISSPEPDPSGKLKLTHQFILTTFSTGTQTIPQLSLFFMTPDGNKAEAKTEPVEITVKSLLEEKGDLGGLQPLKGLFNFKSYLWIWILLGVMTLGVITYFVLKNIKQKSLGENGLPIAPPRPPEEIIWEIIHRLEDSDYLSKEQFKEFYSELSTGLRQYLENRYAMSALDRTTSELMVEFRKNNFSLDLTVLLRDFFESGDLVKFAKFTPNIKDVEDDLLRVKKVVTITTPQAKAKEEKIPV